MCKYLSVFIKPTLNAKPLIHKVTLLDQHSDAFRRSSALSSGSAYLNVNFC